MAVLGNLIEQVRGVSYKPEDLHPTLDENSIILLRANNIKDGRLNFDEVVYVDRKKVSDKQLIRAGDILVCASSGSKELVGKAAYVDADLPMTFGAFCKVVRPKSECPKYFGHYFNSPYYRERISNYAAGANINNIRNEHIDGLEITWPSLEKRSEAVTILDKISELIILRREQLAKLDELVKARFVEIFGDMLLNTMDWNEIQLEELADVVSGITKGRKVKDQELIEVPYMAVSNVKDGYIDWKTVKTIMATAQEIEQYRLLPNDVLMTEGGDPDKVGRGAVIQKPLENSIHQNHIFRVRLNCSKILPTFFAEYLQHQKAKRYFLGCAKQTTGIASINMRQLRALPVLVPPLELQEKFTFFVEQTEKTKLTLQESLGRLEEMKKALMQQYFG